MCKLPLHHRGSLQMSLHLIILSFFHQSPIICLIHITLQVLNELHITTLRCYIHASHEFLCAWGSWPSWMNSLLCFCFVTFASQLKKQLTYFFLSFISLVPLVQLISPLLSHSSPSLIFSVKHTHAKLSHLVGFGAGQDFYSHVLLIMSCKGLLYFLSCCACYYTVPIMFSIATRALQW